MWETRNEAIKALAEFLPTDAELKEGSRWWDQKPDSQLLADESQVIAILKCKDRYGSDTISPFLIAERMFIASCSSSWGWGLRRYPNCQLNQSSLNTAPGGQCDPFEEWKIDELRDGLQRAHKRIETGHPQSAGEFGFIIIDLYASYNEGWQITDWFWDRLAKFRHLTSGYRLNQRGYEVIRSHDDHVVMILPPKPSDYDKYLLESLRELHEQVGGIALGFGQGQLYYLTNDEIFSEAINRLWLGMRNMPRGGVFRDGDSGHRLAERIGLGCNL